MNLQPRTPWSMCSVALCRAEPEIRYEQGATILNKDMDLFFCKDHLGEFCRTLRLAPQLNHDVPNKGVRS